MKFLNNVFLFAALFFVNCGPSQNIVGVYERRIITACNNGIEKLKLDKNGFATIEIYLSQSNLRGKRLYSVEYGKLLIVNNEIKVILDSTIYSPNDVDKYSSCNNPQIPKRDSISLLNIPNDAGSRTLAIRYFDNCNKNYRWAEYTMQP